MMHFTRFEINSARRAARSMLASPQKLHAAVLAAFPTTEPDAGAEGRILWRVDQREHQTVLYLVSPAKPDLTHLVEQIGWPTTHGWDTRSYTELLDRLRPGTEWTFRLKANPVRNLRKSDEAKRSQRFGHVTVVQQTKWFLDRAEQHGFTIPIGVHDEPDLAVRGRQNLTFPRKERTITLSTAVFEGRLRISDIDAFRRSLIQGIGPAKGYGCGLLTIAPIRRHG